MTSASPVLDQSDRGIRLTSCALCRLDAAEGGVRFNASEERHFSLEPWALGGSLSLEIYAKLTAHGGTLLHFAGGGDASVRGDGAPSRARCSSTWCRGCEKV